MEFHKVNNEDFKKTLISYKKKIKNLIELFEKNHLQIALVIDDKKKIKGIVTDGDLRRGILKYYNLDTQINQICNKNYYTVNPKTKNYKDIMIEKKINHLPILNQFNKPIGLIVSENLYKHKDRKNLFVIIAGGKGTRLMPRTKNLPKPLLKVSGKTILERIIERGKFFGYKNFIISTNYLGSKIKKEIGNGNKFDLKINYLNEKIAMGTAGSLSLLNKKNNLPLIVSNGDVLSSINYHDLLEFHYANNADLTAAVYEKKLQNPFGIVKFKKNSILEIKEKPISTFQILAGIYVINPNIIKKYIKKEYYNMTDLINDLIKVKKNRVLSYNISQNWIDVGNEENYIHANNYYSNYV